MSKRSSELAPEGRGGFKIVFLAALLFACESCSTSPSTPPEANRVVVTAASPTSGALVIPAAFPYNELGGVVLPRQSGVLSVNGTLALGRDVPFGQLNVYLLTGSSGTDYCGQNLPDSPTWRSLPSGWTTTFTITGFQIYRLPCVVTGIRVIFHTRDSGALSPPTPTETIAEATLSTTLQISQQPRP